jgi:hypothetical protein
MFRVMDNLTYDISRLGDNRVRVIVRVGEKELGVLYFEKPKMGWGRKPVVPHKWVCVDAKVETLYVYGGNDITPKDIVAKCQELIGDGSLI